MLGGPTALWISPSGKNLAFIRFNDTDVLEYKWPIYGEPGNIETIYPEYKTIRYPKVLLIHITYILKEITRFIEQLTLL